MPQHAARKATRTKPPGGRRVSGTEVQRRLDHADKLLRSGSSRGDVVESMVGTFHLSTRAADSYIARVRERWAKESTSTRDTERTASLARLERLSEKAEQRGAFAAAVSAEKLRAQINGLLAPLEVKTTVATASAEPEMTYEQALDELEALDEIVKGMRREGLLQRGN